MSPHKPFEQEDPLEWVRVELPGSLEGGIDPLEEMARTFIDEFALMGWGRQELLGLFKDPFYQGPHAIYCKKGEAFVLKLIAERVPGGDANG